MDTVTYPDPRVVAQVGALVVPLKISLLEKHPDYKEATGGTAIPWAPTLLYTDGKGREFRRTIGWFDPAEFLGELQLAAAHFHLSRWRFAEALAAFELTASEHAATLAGPEAGYYAGVTRYLSGKRDMAALAERWNQLRARHPGNDWSVKASVIDDWTAAN